MYKGQIVHYTGDKILFDGATITDGPFTSKIVLLQVVLQKVGYVERNNYDPVVGSVIRITYDDDTLGGTACQVTKVI